MVTRVRPTISAFAICSFLLPATVQATPIFRGLGSLNPHEDSLAYGVSSDGSVVVGSSGWSQAVRWTDTGIQNLNFLPPGSCCSSSAVAASRNGHAIVGQRIWEGAAYMQPIRWTTSNGAVVLPSIPIYNSISDLSDDGMIMVGRASYDRNGWLSFEAFRWTDGGTTGTGLGFLSSNRTTSQAFGVSRDGAIVVGASTNNDGIREAFRWTEADGMQGLGFGGFSPSENYGSIAFSVSGDGRVIVGSVSGPDFPDGYAFYWTEDMGMQLLPILVDYRFVVGRAYAASYDGSIIVGSASSSGRGAEAFIFQGGEMKFIQDWLFEDFSIDIWDYGFEWLISAQDVSDDGKVIVGYGLNVNGFWEAWKLDLRGGSEPGEVAVAEPSSIALVIFGLLGLSFAARRRRAAA